MRLFINANMTIEMPHTNIARVESIEGAQNGTNTDLVTRGSTRNKNGDYGDDRLRKSRPHRRQHAANRSFTQIELASEPFHAVHEQLATGKNHSERHNEEEDSHSARL